MGFKKSTRYALYAAMEMTRAGEAAPLTATQVAQRYSIPVAVMAKVFQELVRAGLAVGTRGVGGGYRLARKPSEITVLDVIEAFEPPLHAERCLLSDGKERCTSHDACRLRRLFDEVEQNARSTYASVTLETLVGAHTPHEIKLRVIR